MTTRAAIYARRSKEQDDAEDETKSVNRQVENARVFATAKGWTVLEPHIYIDDGISGSSAPARLKDKARMLLAITSAAPPPFEVLICQDPDRFSRRDGDEAFAELKMIAKAGVQVWFYSDGSRFQYGDFASNTLSFLKSEFAAQYRRGVSQKTYEAHRLMAQLGHVTGGRVFGYTNIEVEKHVERVINADEAAVIVWIFDLRAAGFGYTRIAKTLNAARACCPRPQQDRPAGWSPSTVREVLHRDMYRGIITWNKTKKRDASGDVHPSPKSEEHWVRTYREDLRIVTDEQWEAAHALIRKARSVVNTPTGPRTFARRDYDSNYLLTGFVRCDTCGGSMAVVSRRRGGERVYFYGCLANWKRGATICPNDLVLPMHRVNDAVLQALAGDVLRPAVVSAIIEGVLEQLLPKNIDAQVDGFRRQLRSLDARIQQLTDSLELGGKGLPSVIARLSERQQEREALLVEMTAAETLHQIHIDRDAIEATVQQSVSEWRTLLNGSVADARQMLREVLEAPLRFTPEGQTYRFSGPVATGRLIAGAVVPTRVASPSGFEPESWP